MSSLLEGNEEQLERELAAGAIGQAGRRALLLLHCGLLLSIVLYYILGGFFHSNLWGGSAPGGAIRVESSPAALPLPSDQPQTRTCWPPKSPARRRRFPSPKSRPRRWT